MINCSDYNYIYRWKNNTKRTELYGRKCKVITRGKMNTILVEFENGERVTTSRYAVLPIKPNVGKK